MRLTPSQLRQLCNQYGLIPSKHYGQNFLITDWPIKKMLEAANLRKTDTVIEIGPGFGVLTFALAERAGKVIAFEIERKFEGYWDEQIETKKLGNLEIVWGNALNLLSTVGYKLKPKTYKLIANLPYQITSRVLRTLLELENKPESITIMVQKEVAERICSKPRDMSLLSVSVQYYGEPKIIDIVTKGNFWPEPKVDSAILKIDLTKSGIASSADANRLPRNDMFFKVVKAGFANKRKQLWKNLTAGLKLPAEKVKAVVLTVARNEKARAEELSVENWIEIAWKLSN